MSANGVSWNKMVYIMLGELAGVGIIFVGAYYVYRRCRRRPPGYQRLDENNGMEELKSEYRKQIFSLNSQLEIARREKEEALSRQMEEIQEMQYSNNQLEIARKRKEEALSSKIEELQFEHRKVVHGLNNQLEIARREKEEALSRLSEIAAKKLKEDNATIADLSTENRPTKIAERYKELYDNEWTEAFNELEETHNMSDEKGIKFLLDTLLDAFEFCRVKYKSRRTQMSQAVASPDPLEMMEDRQGFTSDQQLRSLMDEKRQERRKTQKNDDGEQNIKLSGDCTDLVKQLLKASAECLIPHLQNTFIEKKFSNFRNGSAINAYIRKCVEITWFMNVQLPPMSLDDPLPRDTEFDRNIYSVYTVSGRLVDYVVWPVCRVEKHGLLLSKGILQPIKS